MSSMLPEPEKIQLSKLPYVFRKRLATLAPTGIVNELSKLCKNEKIEAYDHVFITDNDKVFQWASKDTFLFCIFKFLHQFTILRFFLDGMDYTNPMWEAVVHISDIKSGNQRIYVHETLVLYCDSAANYDYVIQNVYGPYTRLILHGNIRARKVLQLIHPGVKRVRINASVQMSTQYYDYFANSVAKQFHDFNSCFVLLSNPTITQELKTKLSAFSRRHKSLCAEIAGTKERICIEKGYNIICFFLSLLCLSVCCGIATCFITEMLVVMTYKKCIFGVILSTFIVCSHAMNLCMLRYPPRTDEIDVSML